MTRELFFLPNFVFPLHHGKFLPRPTHFKPAKIQHSDPSPVQPVPIKPPLRAALLETGTRRKRGQKAKLEFQYDTISETCYVPGKNMFVA